MSQPDSHREAGSGVVVSMTLSQEVNGRDWEALVGFEIGRENKHESGQKNLASL
jgi:hypothetical protein